MVAGIPIPPSPTRGSRHDVSDSGSSDASATSEEESSVEESGNDDDIVDFHPDAKGSTSPTAGHPSKGASKEPAAPVGVPVDPGVSGMRNHGSASTSSASPRTSSSNLFLKDRNIFFGTWKVNGFNHFSQAVPRVLRKIPRIYCDYPISSGETQPCLNSSTFLCFLKINPGIQYVL